MTRDELSAAWNEQRTAPTAETMQIALDVAAACLDLAEYDTADKVLQDAVSIWLDKKAAFGEYDFQLKLLELGEQQERRSDWRAAEICYQRGICEADHCRPLNVLAYWDLARLSGMLGRPGQAVEMAHAATEVTRSHFDDGLSLAMALTTEADYLLRDGRGADASTACIEALPLCPEINHLARTDAHLTLADCALADGNLERASESLNAAYASMASWYSAPQFPGEAACAARYCRTGASFYRARGDLQGEVAFRRREMDLRRSLHETDRPWMDSGSSKPWRLACALESLGDALSRAGENAEAEQLFVEARDLRSRLKLQPL